MVLRIVAQIFNNFEVYSKKYNTEKDLFLKVVFLSTKDYIYHLKTLSHYQMKIR